MKHAIVSESERTGLIAAYVAYWRATENSIEQAAHFWAIDAFYAIAQESPLLCLRRREDIMSLEFRPESDKMTLSPDSCRRRSVAGRKKD